MAMTQTTVGAPAPGVDELVERAAALRPLLQANEAQSDRERRLAEANVQAVRDAGLCRIMVPRRFGGYETDLRTSLSVMSELARGSAATSWAMSLVNVCSWLIGLYPERAQQDVWGEDPDAWGAGSLNPFAGEARRVEGGLRVTGRWPYSSGCLHAQWGVVGLRVLDEQGQIEDLGLSLIPMGELSIEDTWFMAGMRGSGSNTIVANDAFVPEHRFLSYAGGAFEGRYRTEHTDEALYRSAFVPMTVLVLVGPQLGLARTALEYVTEKAAQRGISHTGFLLQRESAGFQIRLAEAAITIDGAHLHAFRAAEDVDRAAASGAYPDRTARARMRLDAARAARQCREAMDMLVEAHGTSSLADANPLQQMWRDMEVASRHAITDWLVNLEVYGKLLLGVEPSITELI
jgi:3-hydroxy-9,10-secoandrosta-1,3,5(10)-triene-9,17-dione monooxygenase